MSPETGTIFTAFVNLELSDEQRANTDAEDILRETKEIFDSYSVPRTEAGRASTQDSVQEDLNQYKEKLKKSGHFSFRGKPYNRQGGGHHSREKNRPHRDRSRSTSRVKGQSRPDEHK